MPRALLRSACVLTLALATTGCASMADRMVRADAPQAHTGTGKTPLDRFGHQLAEQPERIQLLPRPGSLSPAQVQALHELARRWQEDGRGSVSIQAPAGGANAVVAGQAAAAAAQVLQSAGVPQAAIVQSSYNAAGQAAPTVSVGYVRLAAVVPDCSTFVTDVTRTGANEPYGSFGCAVTANMAVQAADPQDLLGPKPDGAPDTARRAFVLDTYRKGKPTGTPRSNNPAESSQASER